ncbi:MAG: hypothetical protein AAF597_07005, partial [Bacteroidota bacterium]
MIDLVAPEQQQLIALGGEYRFKGEGRLRIEGSRSNLDLNRFSDVDGADDAGSALRVDLDRTLQFGPDSLGWSLAGRGQYEFVQSTYNFINPYRSPEFFRNWNLSNRLGTTVPEPENEQIIGAGFGLIKERIGRVDYDYEQFQRGNSYDGRRHAAQLQLATKGWRINGAASLLDSRAEDGEGSFRRPSLSLAKTFEKLGGWTLKTDYQGERSVRRPVDSDTLSRLSFQFDRYAVGLDAPGNENYRFGLSANQRTDLLPRGTELVTATRAREIAAEGNYTAGKNVQLGGGRSVRPGNPSSASSRRV